MTAGIPVAGRATTEVERGDQYYAQAEWKLAFRAYRNAYRLATRL
jgi:hypothetical protein